MERRAEVSENENGGDDGVVVFVVVVVRAACRPKGKPRENPEGKPHNMAVQRSYLDGRRGCCLAVSAGLMVVSGHVEVGCM